MDPGSPLRSGRGDAEGKPGGNLHESQTGAAEISCPAASSRGIENKEENSVLSNRSNRAFPRSSSPLAVRVCRCLQTFATSDLPIGRWVTCTLFRLAASRPARLTRQDRNVCGGPRFSRDYTGPEFDPGCHADEAEKAICAAAVEADSYRLTGNTRLPARFPEEQNSSRDEEGSALALSFRVPFTAQTVRLQNGVPVSRHVCRQSLWDRVRHFHKGGFPARRSDRRERR